MKKYFLSLMGLLILGSIVSAELGAICKGNVLFYIDYKGKSMNRSCDVLQAGSQFYKGECRDQSGGAACYRTDMLADQAYMSQLNRDRIATANSVTTTTLRLPVINLQCPSCEKCRECESVDSYKEQIYGLKIALNQTADNLEYYRLEANSKISKLEFNNQIAEKDKVIKILTDNRTVLQKARLEAIQWSNYYKGGIYFCGLIIFVLFIIYIYYEKLEDVKFTKKK